MSCEDNKKKCFFSNIIELYADDCRPKILSNIDSLGTKHLLAGGFNIFSLRISVDFSFLVLNKSCDLFLGSLRLYKTFM